MGRSRLAAVLAPVLGRVAALRRGSAIHEVGTTYDAVVRTTGAGPGPFEVVGEQAVVVRVSRGLGLPPPWPDVVGLGIRLVGPTGPQDLLLDSCGRGRLTRHVPTLRRDLDRGPLGTLIALRHGTTVFHVGAFPRGRSGAGRVLDLATAPPYGRWTTVGSLVFGAPTADQSVRLSPANSSLGVTLSPWWQQLRVWSYRASRKGATR